MRRAGWIVACASLLLAPNDVSAQTGGATRAEAPQDWRAEIERLRAEVVRLQEELRALRSELERARAGEAGLVPRLLELEQSKARLEAELLRVADELKHASDSLDAMSEAERRRPNVTVYGTLQAYKYQGATSVLDAEAFELVLSGKPHKRLGFFAEIEFERAAAVGGERGGEVVLEQAYASYAFAPWLSLRAGVLLVPFGNVNVDHYSPLRDVVSKPLVSYAVAPSDWTENGVQLYGRQPLGTRWQLDYQACVVAGLDSRLDPLGLRQARQAFGVDNNGDKALVGRVALARGAGLEAGVSGYTGKYDDRNTRRLNGWALDTRSEIGPLRVTGEYNRFVADRGPLRAARFSGYYLRASWDLRGGPLRRIAKDFDDPRLTLVLQYDAVTIEAPLSDVFERNHETRFTWGLAYRPSRQWVLKLSREENSTTHRALLKGDADGWLGSLGFVF